MLGDGACVGDGETTFQDFIGQVLAEGSAEGWEFDPDRDHEHAGRPAFGRNEGGEAHTFTPVQKFGGGFVEVLNVGQAPIPECVALRGGQPIPVGDGTFVPSTAAINTLVPAGDNGGRQTLKKGVNKFQCCIHPWMRTTIQGE